MISSEHVESKWLTSVELFEMTGISRATLNNYIKMGLIPKPIVRRPDDPSSRAKKIGFFPQSVIDSISAVQRMKKEGMSMESIVSILCGKHSSAQSGTPESDKHVVEEYMPSDRQHTEFLKTTDDFEIKHNNSGRNMQEGLLLNLSINDINCPAFLINNNFEIDWINTEAEKNIFNFDIKSIKDASERNIFKLFSKMGLLSNDRDTEVNDLVSYLMKFVKNTIQKNSIKKLYDDITEKEILLLQNVYDNVKPLGNESRYATYLKLGGNSEKDSFPHHAYHVVFREGILIILAHMDDVFYGIVDLVISRQKIIQELMRQRMPSLISFSVLVADLQDSSRICAELPPEEYFELIRDIWKYMHDIFKKYYGTYGKHVGDGMVFYFLKEKNSNYILNSIYCALELREKMKQLNMEWKTRKGWLNDLFLNIAINEGQEYFGNTPSPNMEFTALGDTVNYASRLSDVARFGAIWTTKNLLNKLGMDQRKTLHYGIRRMEQNREIFGENLFARVVDMVPTNDSNYSKFMDIATLSITEIISTSSYYWGEEIED
ncbi:MAG: adenylate/guanylate cyclase domain-containing protein [Pseudomonadota bacterium]